MSNETLVQWHSNEVTRGNRIVVLEAFANSVVVGVVGNDELKITYTSNGSENDGIIGLGIRFEEPSVSDETFVVSASAEPRQSSPPFVFPLRGYTGEVQLSL